MSLTAIGPIESAVHTTNAWLKEVANELGWQDRENYHAMGAVLHALRDRLTVAEAADLGAQLPTLIRGLYYDGWNPNGKPVKEQGRKTSWLTSQRRAEGRRRSIRKKSPGLSSECFRTMSPRARSQTSSTSFRCRFALYGMKAPRRTADGRPRAAVEPAMKTIHDDAETIRHRWR